MDSSDSPQTPLRYLLSGASGMLGSALRAELARKKGQVVSLVRRSPGREELHWDPPAKAPFATPALLEGFDVAIHLSGANVAAHRWTKAYRREMCASRVDSTHALATALAGLDRPPRTLLVASAIGIYGDRGDEVLDEDSLPGRGILPDLCRAWEAASEPASAAGIRVVHLRFGVVLRRGAGALGQMLPIFSVGLGGRLGSGRQWMSWIGLPDLVASVFFAAETPKLAGAVNIVAPNPVTNAEFTHLLARTLHRPALLPVPAFALRLVFGQMADEALLASARINPRKLLEAGYMFTEPELDQALLAALD